MKTVLLHGLGQTARDWDHVVMRTLAMDAECPELFDAGGHVDYFSLLNRLEQRYADASEPFRICGLSLGAILAMDFAIRHKDKTASLILIGAQYKMPRRLIDFQNILFRCMPDRIFRSMGLSKNDAIRLTRPLRSLDFRDALHEIVCPVTILCGERDRANLKASRELKELLPQAALHIVPGAGHELNRDAPDFLAEILMNSQG